MGEDIGVVRGGGQCGNCFGVAWDNVGAIDVQGDDAWFRSIGRPCGDREIASIVLRGDEEPEQLRGVIRALLGNVGCDGAERRIVFTLEENCAEGAASCCDAGGADDRRGRNAEGCPGIRIESHRLSGEAEFGGEGGQGSVGARGGDEGGEGFEGSHAANVAGVVEGSGCEIMRSGTKHCGAVRRAHERRQRGGSRLRGAVPFPS